MHSPAFIHTTGEDSRRASGDSSTPVLTPSADSIAMLAISTYVAHTPEGDLLMASRQGRNVMWIAP